MATTRAASRARDHHKFAAWDLQRSQRRELAPSPSKIRQHRVDWREWASLTPKPSRRNKKRKTNTSKPTVTATSILKNDEYEFECLHCGRDGNDPDCGVACYRDFRKTVLTGEDHVELRHVGAMGYGVFTKPWSRLAAGQYLDEYLGDLRPLNSDESDSRYCFWIPGKCIVDAEHAGNWTRYINSHCRPNVHAEPGVVGKRDGIFFRAARDIGPGEELVFDYGKKYFQTAGIVCRCSVCVAKKGRVAKAGGVKKSKK